MSNKSKSPNPGRTKQIKVGSTLDTLQREEGRVTFMENIRANGKVYLLVFTVIMAIAIFGGLGIGQFGNTYSGNSVSYDNNGKKIIKKPAPSDFIRDMLIAKCEGESILRTDFERNFRDIVTATQSQDGGTIEPIKLLQLRDVRLRDTIEQIVLRKYAKDKKIVVNESKVKESIEFIKKQFTKKPDKATEKKPDSIVGAIKGKLSPGEDYQAWYDYLRSNNLDEFGFRNEVRKSQLAQQAREDMQKGADEKQYKELIPKAEKILKEINEGKITWDAAVLKYSDADKVEKGKKGETSEPVWKTMRSHEWVDKVFAKGVKPGQILPPMQSGAPTEPSVEIIKYVDTIVPAASEIKDEAFKMQWTERYKTWWKDDEKKSKNEKLTDDELKDVATKVKVQRILLNVKNEGEVEKQLNTLVENSKTEIYDPLLLAFRAYDGAAERTAAAIKAGKDHLTEKEMTETRFVMRPGEQMSIFVYQSGKRRFDDAIKYARIIQTKNNNQVETWQGYYLEAMLYREWFKAPDALSKPTEKVEDVIKLRDKAITDCLAITKDNNPWVYLEQAYVKFALNERKVVEECISEVMKYGGHQPTILDRVKKFYKDEVKDMKRYAEIDMLGKADTETAPTRKPETIEIPEDVSKAFDADMQKETPKDSIKTEPQTKETNTEQKPTDKPKVDNKEPEKKESKPAEKPQTNK